MDGTDEKQVIHFVTGQICEEIGEAKEIEFSKEAIATISEIVYRQSVKFATDLELFTHHARRKKVSPDDVLMVARKIPDLQNHLKSFKPT